MIGLKRMLCLAHLGVVIAVTCCGVTVPASAAEELALAWKRQPGTEGYDAAYGAATDAVGNVYLAGQTNGSLGGAKKGDASDLDAWVRKYAASGQLLWQRQPGTDGYDNAECLATDAAGDVYIAGWTGGSLAGAFKGSSDAWVRKYDSSGRLLWQRQPGTKGGDIAYGVATDAAGDVYIAGGTSGSLGGAKKGNSTDSDAWLAKYDSSGRRLWQRQPGTEDFDFASSVATDEAGNVFVAGSTLGSLAGPNKGSRDAWLLKYAASGRLLWQRQPGTEANDVAFGVATDAAGNVYLAGGTVGSLGGPQMGGGDVWVGKYDPSGRLLWMQQLGTGRDEYPKSVATDAAGNVYLAGYTEGSFGGPHRGGGDVWMAKYDPLGRLLWLRQLGTEGYDFADGLATDAAGDVYFAGVTNGSLGGTYKDRGDAWLMKFSPAE